MMKLAEDKKTDKRFNRMQWRMLFATMIGYTLFYFMRKNVADALRHDDRLHLVLLHAEELLLRDARPPAGLRHLEVDAR